jgi:hypothetical protein
MKRQVRSKRDDQIFVGGVGASYSTPLKARNDRKSGITVKPIGYDTHHGHLMSLLHNLEAGNPPPEPSKYASHTPPYPPSDFDPPADVESTIDEPPEQQEHTDDIPLQDEPSNPAAGQDPEPDDSEENVNVTAVERDRLYEKWNNRINLLIQPYLDFLSRSFGKRHEEADSYKTTCTKDTCLKRTGRFRGLHFDRELFMKPLLVLNLKRLDQVGSSTTSCIANARTCVMFWSVAECFRFPLRHHVRPSTSISCPCMDVSGRSLARQ